MTQEAKIGHYFKRLTMMRTLLRQRLPAPRVSDAAGCCSRGRHSGTRQRREPGISRFRVRCFASPRNDKLTTVIASEAKQSIVPQTRTGLLRRWRSSQ